MTAEVLTKALGGRWHGSYGNRAAFNLAQFVKADALPEDWARGQLEAHAVGVGLSVIEARRTIESAFYAAEPRSLPS